MAIVGWEWIAIGVVAIVIILWGPAKIPEFAKALGRAKGEFDKAQKEFTNATVEASKPALAVAPPPPSALKSKDEMLLDAAQKLGIPTEGKTREQISDEISMKAKLLGAK